jgi:hypothetical protein
LDFLQAQDLDIIQINIRQQMNSDMIIQVKCPALDLLYPAIFNFKSETPVNEKTECHHRKARIDHTYDYEQRLNQRF